MKADYCSNAVTCNGVTVFVTFSVLFCVFDYNLRRAIVTVIKYNYFDVFAKVFRYFFKYSVLLEKYRSKLIITLCEIMLIKNYQTYHL